MISFNEVLQLHNKSIKDFGGSYGIRDTNLLESAIARPYQSFGEIEFYPTPFEKAAALIESIVKNHPFIDGNKRTGFLACYVLLYQNKIRLTADQELAYQFVIDIASSNIQFEDIVIWLRQHTQSL